MRAAPPQWRDEAELLDEPTRVSNRRYQEAVDAGFSHEEASAFSYSGADVGVLRLLVGAGCDPALIARIVL